MASKSREIKVNENNLIDDSCPMVLSAENSQRQLFLMFDNPPCGQVIVFAELLQKIVPTAVFQIALFLIHYQNVIVSLTTKRLTLYSAELKFSYTEFLYAIQNTRVNKKLSAVSFWRLKRESV